MSLAFEINGGHIFISYARLDGCGVADRLYQAFCERGMAAWRDERSIDPHQDFSAEIEKAIEAASHVVVCLTPSIAERRDSFVRREIVYAQGIGRPVTPILFPGFPTGRVPVLINHLTWLSFADPDHPHEVDFERGFFQLLKRLARDAAPDKPTSSIDPFREYLEELYRHLVSYLDQTVFSLVQLGSSWKSDGTEVQVRASRSLPMSLFSAALPIRQTSGTSKGANEQFETIAEAFAAADGQLLLLGEPGAGKTTSLIAFAREAVACRLEDREKPLPIIGRLADWARLKPTQLLTWLSANIGVNPGIINRELRQAGVLMLLDGLDEIGPARFGGDTSIPTELTDKRISFMEALQKELENNQAIVTCRAADYEALGRKIALRGAVVLRPLDDIQLENYLSDSSYLWKAVSNDKRLREIVRTPLILSLLTFAYRAAGDQAEQLCDPAAAPGELRERIFRTYVERRFEHERLRAKTQLPFSIEQCYQHLGRAALDNQDFECPTRWGLENRPGVSVTESLENTLGDEVESFIEQALRLHLLVQDEQSGLRFIHLLVRDHFGFPKALESLSGYGIDTLKALELLVSTGDRRAVGPALESGLRDGRLHYPYGYYLAYFRDSRLVLPFARTLSSEHHVGGGQIESYCSEDAADTLLALSRNLGKHAVENILISAINEASGQDIADYALALGIIHSDNSQQMLISFLQHDDAQVRGCAAFALGAIGSPQALKELSKLRLDSSLVGRGSRMYPRREFREPASSLGPTVGKMAMEAIQKIQSR